MNIEYLQKEILPQRSKEFQEGKNLGTARPIYVVLDLREQIMSGHSEFSPSTNLKGIQCMFGYYDESLDCEDREFKKSDKNMKSPIAITRFYTDNIVAFFLTSKAAHKYLKYQSHNLSKRAYVYVFNAGYANYEMENLLTDK